MAKRSRTSTAIVRAAPAGAAPIVRISAPRPVAAPKKKRGGRRRASSASAPGTAGVVQFAMGGAALAMVEKSGIDLPTIPLIGKKGTIGVAAYFIGKQTRSPLAFTVARLCAGLAAYEYMKDGKVSGDDDDMT
jgi:hypothetical protein